MHSIYTILLLLPFITVHHAFVQHHSQHWPFTKSNIEKLIKKKNVDALRKKLSIPSYGEVINYRRENNKIDPDEFFRKSITPRIFNGEESDPSDFQYMVSLKWPFDDGYLGGHYCGGTLIAENVVLTAAHCILGESEVEIAVKGDTKHKNGSETFRSVGSGVVHPYYQFTHLDFDIAVLYLDGKSTVKPIGLSNIIYHEDTTEETIVTGWGLTETGMHPDHLLEVDVDLMSNEDCNDNTDYNGLITDSMLCATKAEEGKDSCFGDSGGPLMINEDDEWKQIGIVSFGGEVCADVKAPGVYSRISHSYNWIMDRLEDASTPAPTPFYGNGTEAPISSPTAVPTAVPTASQVSYVYNQINQYHVGYTPNTYVSTQFFEDDNCTIPLGESETTIFKVVQEQHVCSIATRMEYKAGIISDVEAYGVFASCDNGLCTASRYSGMSCVDEPDDQITGSEDSCISDESSHGSLKLKLETSIPSGQARFDYGVFGESQGAAILVESFFLSTEECTTIDGYLYSAQCNNGAGTIYLHDNGCENEGYPLFTPIANVVEMYDGVGVVLRCENGVVN